jgi:hypothetical protein
MDDTGTNTGSGSGSDTGTASTQPADISQLSALTLPQLNEEKRNLHGYLKAYEKTFQKTHNRQVTRQEDIAPVASEYARYKEVKQLLAARNIK